MRRLVIEDDDGSSRSGRFPYRTAAIPALAILSLAGFWAYNACRIEVDTDMQGGPDPPGRSRPFARPGARPAPQGRLDLLQGSPDRRGTRRGPDGRAVLLQPDLLGLADQQTVPGAQRQDRHPDRARGGEDTCRPARCSPLLARRASWPGSSCQAVTRTTLTPRNSSCTIR